MIRNPLVEYIICAVYSVLLVWAFGCKTAPTAQTSGSGTNSTVVNQGLQWWEALLIFGGLTLIIGVVYWVLPMDGTKAFHFRRLQ